MKTKIYIIILMMLLLIPIALSAKCEDILTPNANCTMVTPSISCATYTYEIFNATSMNGSVVTNGSLTLLNDSIYFFVFNETRGDYIVKLCDSSTREISVRGEDDMGSLAIMIFVLAIAGALFVLPFVKKEFSKFPIANIIIRRGIWSVAVYLMMLNSAIAATIAESIGLPVTQEMFRYMWFFGIAGWLGILILAFSTLVNVLKLWKLQVAQKRMNFDEEDF